MRLQCLLVAALLLRSVFSLGAETPWTPPPPDPRFKVDVLLIVAHPDDDTLAGTYLAKLRFDAGKKVAVVFATRGDAGGNQVGAERASSLGLAREMEARADLASLDINLVWFLGGRDTPTQNPLVSLANWDHGRTLAEAVRVVRLTRPEVILTWLPRPVVGENHGDHQAASILATEAFDFAADPTMFPSQVAASSATLEPRLENLHPWQPKKLYFMSDASDTRFMDGHGPSYSITEMSPSRKVPYWELALAQLKPHRTQFASQYDRIMATSPADRARLITGNPGGEGLIDPLRFVLGKTLVGGTPTGDVFEGITPEPLSRRASAAASDAASAKPAPIGLGSQWYFYPQFWRAHGLSHMPELETAMGPFEPGQVVRVPVRVVNESGAMRDITLTANLPAGWKEWGDRPQSVKLAPGADYTFETGALVPDGAPDGTVDVRYSAEGLGSVSVRVLVKAGGGGLPQ
jgi:LmbE family N-acetylglucosaminyl deacetylase